MIQQICFWVFIQRKQNHYLKKYLHSQVHCSIVYSSQEMKDMASLVSQLVKNLPANMGDPGLTPELGRSSGEGNGNPLQYSCLENPMDREGWWATVHGITIFYIYIIQPLEKGKSCHL